MYELENDDKMQTCTSWSTSRVVPMPFTALEMRCDAENDIQMQVGAAADDDSRAERARLRNTALRRDSWRATRENI